MCGITGLLAPAEASDDELRAAASRMAGTLAHRGPDDADAWADAAAGVALGHRRLAVIDLSPLARQPMLSACGRYCLVYNGEVYNHRSLRRELEAAGEPFRGHSDTEVLLAAWRRWGPEETLRRLVGMFALAVWDRRQRTLTLARDALGIKPLYYGWQAGHFLFASELKALRAHPAFREEIDRGALASFFRHGYIPGPQSIYRGVFKLPPGTMLSVTSVREPAAPRAWWNAEEVVAEAQRHPLHVSPQEAVNELDARLREAVGLQMEADVRLGAFLSGGIDSSAVVALMQSQSAGAVKTFTVGFDEAALDEAPHARAVAQHLGTEHTEFRVTAAEAREEIPRLAHVYDEPFADSSQIPTLLLCRLARQHVTVCLSGDGGDELFCGYERYFYLHRLWKRVGWCPAPIRSAVAAAARRLGAIEKIPTSRKLRTLAEFLAPHDGLAFYRHFNAHWRRPGEIVLGGAAAVDGGGGAISPSGRGLVQRMMDLDLVTYLPDDLLVKVDRASMAFGLEVRVPLLDHRLVAFAAGVPLALKVRTGQTKWLLRQVLARYVPPSLFDRPKMGFAVPLAAWLRGPLRAWAEELLAENRLRREGFLRAEPIRRKWQEHLSKAQNWQYLLWDVLMFESWLDAQGASPNR